MRLWEQFVGWFGLFFWIVWAKMSSNTHFLPCMTHTMSPLALKQDQTRSAKKCGLFFRVLGWFMHTYNASTQCLAPNQAQEAPLCCQQCLQLRQWFLLSKPTLASFALLLFTLAQGSALVPIEIQEDSSQDGAHRSAHTPAQRCTQFLSCWSLECAECEPHLRVY